MKELTFTVNIKFADKISSDEEIKEVADNIARAIKRETNGIGIAPEASETYTESIEVKPQFLDYVARKEIV